MGIFSKTSIETQLAEAQTALATANQTNTDLTTQLATANQQVTDLTTQLATANQQVADMTAARDTATQQVTALETQIGAIAGALEFTADQRTALTGENAVATARAAVTAIAQREAVSIAASQGNIPPVQTEAGQTGASKEDDIRAAHEAAHAESDPIKRAALHAKASAMVSGNN